MCYSLRVKGWAGYLLLAWVGLLLCAGSSVASAQERTLILVVQDARTADPLPGAVAHRGRLHLQTDQYGRCRLPLLPQETDGLHVHLLGYHPAFVAREALLRAPDTLRLQLRPEERQLSGVSVQGTRRTISVNTVATRLSTERLERGLGRSLASLLGEVSGVTTLQTGTTTAKPVIHGMYGNRVLIVNQGVRQSGQQWGDDHAPEVDIESSSNIQVVKGAEAVRYGSEAIAGAVILDQATLPYGEAKLHGSVGTAYATNGRRTSSSARLESALPFAPEVAFRLQASYTNAGDRSSARYLLQNTGVREFNYSATLGWKHKDFSLEGLFSQYQNKTGLLPSGHLTSREGMVELLERGMPDIFRPFSREIGSPYHDVTHHLGKIKASWHHERLGDFTLQASLQKDLREEFAVRRNSAYAHVPTLSLSLSSKQVDGRWHKHYHRWDSEVGVHGEWLDNYSNPGTGFTPPIPNYAQNSYGVHALQKYQDSRLGAEVGLRLDQLAMGVSGVDFLGKAYSGDHRFTNLTYSLGGHVHLGHRWKLTTNFGLAWRAPHVQELYSFGSLHGSAIFVYGDQSLRSERGYKWVTSLSHHDERFDFDLDGYLHWIDGYIYDEPTREFVRVITGEYPVFRYRQRDAFFRGLDLDTRYYVLPERLFLRSKGSMIWANERKTGRYFPYIPALRLSEEVGTRIPELLGGSAELSLGHQFVDRQSRFDPATDLTDSPAGYHLFGLEASYTRPLGGRQSLRLTLSADNLLNTQYKEYTNRARYYSHDVGRDIRFSLHYKF